MLIFFLFVLNRNKEVALHTLATNLKDKAVTFIYTTVNPFLRTAALMAELHWLSTCVTIKSSAKKSRESAWTIYHQKLLEHLTKSTLSPQVLSHVSRSLLHILIDINFTEKYTQIIRSETGVAPITDDDKDIIEYIAGFTMQRLKRKVMRQANSVDKSEWLQLIDHITVCEAQPTSKLIAAKQRGGLLTVTEELVPLFTKLEYLLRKYMAHQGEVIQEISVDEVLCCVFEDDYLPDIYEAQVSDVLVQAENKDSLYKDMIVTYLKTRCSGYCRQQIENYRLNTRTHKKEKSLRNTLS